MYSWLIVFFVKNTDYDKRTWNPMNKNTIVDFDRSFAKKILKKISMKRKKGFQYKPGSQYKIPSTLHTSSFTTRWRVYQKGLWVSDPWTNGIMKYGRHTEICFVFKMCAERQCASSNSQTQILNTPEPFNYSQRLLQPWVHGFRSWICFTTKICFAGLSMLNA